MVNSSLSSVADVPNRTVTKETISVQEYQVVAGFFFFYIAMGVSQAICVAVSEVIFANLLF